MFGLLFNIAHLIFCLLWCYFSQYIIILACLVAVRLSTFIKVWLIDWLIVSELVQRSLLLTVGYTVSSTHRSSAHHLRWTSPTHQLACQYAWFKWNLIRSHGIVCVVDEESWVYGRFHVQSDHVTPVRQATTWHAVALTHNNSTPACDQQQQQHQQHQRSCQARDAAMILVNSAATSQDLVGLR